MTVRPDPGPGWRYAGGNDYKDVRCQIWCPDSKKWIERVNIYKGCSFSKTDYYRIPLDRATAKQAGPVSEQPASLQGLAKCVDAIQAALTADEFRGFCKGNAIMHCWLEKQNGGDRDIKTANWYLERLAKEKTE